MQINDRVRCWKYGSKGEPKYRKTEAIIKVSSRSFTGKTVYILESGEQYFKSPCPKTRKHYNVGNKAFWITP